MPIPARPLLRPIFGWFLTAFTLLLAVVSAFLLAPFLGRRKAFWAIAPKTVQGFAWFFGIRRSLEGWEQLPVPIREGRAPAIFVANHASLFDPPLIISTLPSRPVFIAKKELARIPVLGWAIWLAGFIFVDRRNRIRALASMREAASRIRAGQCIAAFPEGTRTRTGQPLPFKKGVFALAIQAGAPIVPLGILGGFDLLPPGSWRPRPSAYVIRVGTPLIPEAFPSQDALRAAAEKAMAELMERDPDPASPMGS